MRIYLLALELVLFFLYIMLENNNVLGDISFWVEEVIGPPKVDLVGVGMMILVAIVVWFLSSIGVVIFAFFSLGNFSLWSGVSPILLAMITFFALTLSNMLYLWSAKWIFPHIYTGGRTIFMHISVYSIILYIAIAPFYLIVDSTILSGSGILIAYIAHVLLNIFGLEIIASILSGYRYSLLAIYSSIVSFIITGTLLFFFYEKTNTVSSNALFILLGLSMFAFVISIFLTYFIRYCYYQMYVTSWYDPIWDVFSRIEQESKDIEIEVEKQLLKKN